MTIRHLKIFIAVADAGKMSLAAKQLYLSQPTVSQAIGEIEAYYNVKLFERLSRRLYITDAGKLLLGYARHITTLFNEMEHALHDSAENSILRVGATVTVGTCVLTDIIRRLEKELPALHVEAVVSNTRAIEEKLLRSELDCALVEGEINSTELLAEPVIADELILICSESHPFAKKTTVTADELENQHFLLREKGSGTRALFENYLSSHGVKVYEKWECQSAQAIKNGVMEGQGLSVISRRLVAKELKAGKLCTAAFADRPLTRSFCFVYHKNKYLSAPVLAFQAQCRN